MQTTTVLDCPSCSRPATIAILETTAPNNRPPRHEIRFDCPQRCKVDDAELLHLWVLARLHELETWSDGWPQYEGTADGPSATSTRMSA